MLVLHLFIFEEQSQKRRVQTFRLLGIFLTGKVKAYKRNTLPLLILLSKIFSHRWSVALLEGAQAKMVHEAWVFTICFMASTKVIVLPDQYMKKYISLHVKKVKYGSIRMYSHTLTYGTCSMSSTCARWTKY